MTKTVKDKRFKSGSTKTFFQKLARGLMLPIALLPIAGLFLGIGAGIENIMIQMNSDVSDAALLAPQIIKQIGDVIFGNLPVLFAIGVAIAFTEDAGVAALSAFVGWLVFNMTQNTMIWDYGIVEVWNGATWVQEGASGLASSFNLQEIADKHAGGVIHNVRFVLESYNILWFTEVTTSVVGTNVGINSMQTSVFGGIALGSLVAFLYNKFHTFQMPKVLGFFSGTRFVPIISFLIAPILGFMFLMVWPAIGQGLDAMGRGLASAPAGLDALAFGYVERILIPFGLHHAFYTPLWYTTVGGEFILNGELIAAGNQSIWFSVIEQGLNFNDLTGAVVEAGTNGNMYHTLTTEAGDIYQLTAGVNPGSYMQGKFPFMMFGLPAAGAAMIMAAKKENRQVAISIIGAAAFTSFLTGITEPIEFTFLFLAPWLFFGFHAVMAAGSFWILDLLNANVGMTFSGGIFDIVLFGVVPDVTGSGTNHWHIYWLGAIYAPIYYFVFYWAVRKFDLPTPGRVEGATLKTKADYLAKKDSVKNSDAKKSKGPSKARVNELLDNLGGMENLTSIDACITRLRLSIKDRKAINDQGLKAMGAMGIVGKGNAIQVIFGAEADAFKVELLKIKKNK